MGRYDDEIDFLAAHENPKESRMNRRTRLGAAQVDELRTRHPGIPDDYIDYLTEIGWGSFRECQYMVYGGLIEPSSIFGAEAAQSLKKRVLCFGDNYSGDPGGFLPDDDWAIADIWHGSLSIVENNTTFAACIREQMLMDNSGGDLRAQ